MQDLDMYACFLTFNLPQTYLNYFSMKEMFWCVQFFVCLNCLDLDIK